MGELGDYWREHREYKKGIKAKRRESMPDIVNRIRFAGYEITEHNGGEHIKIHLQAGVVDYWPSTGYFKHGKKKGGGIKKLMNYLRATEPAPEIDLAF